MKRILIVYIMLFLFISCSNKNSHYSRLKNKEYFTAIDNKIVGDWGISSQSDSSGMIMTWCGVPRMRINAGNTGKFYSQYSTKDWEFKYTTNNNNTLVLSFIKGRSFFTEGYSEFHYNIYNEDNLTILELSSIDNIYKWRCSKTLDKK